MLSTNSDHSKRHVKADSQRSVYARIGHWLFNGNVVPKPTMTVIQERHECFSPRVHHSESDTHLYESTKHSAVVAWSTGWLAHREALESPTQKANLPCDRDGHVLVSLSAISVGLWPCISYCDNNAEGPRDAWMSRLWRANEWVNQDLECTACGCLTFTTNVCFNLPSFSLDECLNCRWVIISNLVPPAFELQIDSRWEYRNNLPQTAWLTLARFVWIA